MNKPSGFYEIMHYIFNTTYQISLILDKLYLSTIGCFARNTISGGTTVICSILYFSIACKNSFSSKRGRIILLFPKISPASITEKEYTWKNGNNARLVVLVFRILGEAVARFVTTDKKFLSVNITPFGNPVVPLEHEITATWSLLFTGQAQKLSSMIMFDVRLLILGNLLFVDSVNIMSFGNHNCGVMLQIFFAPITDTKRYFGFDIFNACFNSLSV